MLQALVNFSVVTEKEGCAATSELLSLRLTLARDPSLFDHLTDKTSHKAEMSRVSSTAVHYFLLRHEHLK